MTATIVLFAAAAVCAFFFFRPKVLGSATWRATVTPLASIIGSGFLVAGPILAHAAGHLAWVAMTGLCALGYLFGSAIRYNIRHVETEGDAPVKPFAVPYERVAQAVLAVAYFISVTYYLNLFAAFGLRIWGLDDPEHIRLASTVVIVGIGAVGVFRGLRGMERVEIVAVGLKLSLIGGMIAALIFAVGEQVAAGTFAWDMKDPVRGLDDFRVLLGLVIMVQGFETSRYLGDAYDPETRIRTMRHAQWISTAIYIVFILLITSYFTDRIEATGGETAIIDILSPLSFAVGGVIIVMALSSQLSAAVADINGAAGLLAEGTGHRIPVAVGNGLTAFAAVAITWAANIYEIIAYASKAFVIYYALQSALAAVAAWRRGDKGWAALYGVAVVIAVGIVVFAEPAKV